MNKLELKNSFFWDFDISKMDEEINKRIIIERVLTLGDFKDVKKLIDFYGLEVIKNEIIFAGNIDKKTLNWLSLFLKIPKTKFRCYKKMQLKQGLWAY